MKFYYLHQVTENTYYLDHKLTPEVRAMFAAMTSRTPVGGMAARYEEVVKAIAHRGMTDPDGFISKHGQSIYNEVIRDAEHQLTEYPLSPVVQKFFDQFVARYGHGSILELTGSPTVYADNISWWTAYMLFDNPLVCGQENSTRAVTRKDWPICQEAYVEKKTKQGIQFKNVHPDLQNIHDLGMKLANAEIEQWKTYFKDPVNRERYGLKDKEPFRPALDRARWALPGTISTGVAFSSHIRERARALRDATAFYGGSPEGVGTIGNIGRTYAEAAPGLASLGLREAVYAADVADVPYHLQQALHPVTKIPARVVASVTQEPNWMGDTFPGRKEERTYADAVLNKYRVKIHIQCSMAVSRDWHRHRTMYPITLAPVLDAGLFQVDENYYEFLSDFAKNNVDRYLKLCTDTFRKLRDEDPAKAMLCIPFGAMVNLGAECGLRDFLYMMELRYYTEGANFEYKDQARQALRQIGDQLPRWLKTELKWPEL